MKLQEYCRKNHYQLIIKHHPNSATNESQYSRLEEKVYERLNSMEHVIYYPPVSDVDSHHLAKISDLNISFGGSISRYCLENEYPVLLTKSERFCVIEMPINTSYHLMILLNDVSNFLYREKYWDGRK